MNNLTIIDYIYFFSNQDVIRLHDSKRVLNFVKENNEPVAFFDTESIIFKVTDGNDFFALKSFVNDVKFHNNAIYDLEFLKNNNIECVLLQEFEIKYLNNRGISETKKILLAPWIDDVSFVDCKNRFVKQLHHNESNNLYVKRRRKVKAGVLIALGTLLFFISTIKLKFPDEIFVNPIDYRQLIVDDSTRTINLAINNNKIQIAKSEIKIITKPIEIPTITNLVVDSNLDKKQISESIEQEKKIVKKKQKTKKLVADHETAKDNVTPRKKKDAELNAIKVINSKSAVTFRSTEF